MALAGNKNDMYEHEEVEENEGKELAKELGAIFQKTSAKESTGVEDLFFTYFCIISIEFLFVDCTSQLPR